MKQRVFSVDLLRCMAMLMIVFCHVVGPEMPEARRVFMEMFVGSAALFFMASGAFIFPVKPSAGAFYRRRFGRYVPEFVVWTVVYALLAYYLSPEPYMLKRHLTWVLFQPTWSAGWFLYALTGMYLFAPVLSPWLCGATRRQVEWFLAAFAVAGFIPLAAANTDVEPAMGLLSPFYNCCGYLVAGYYLTRWPVTANTWRRNVVLIGILVALGVLFPLRAYVTAQRWGYARVLDNDLSVNVMAVCMLWFILCSLAKSAPAAIRWPVTLVSLNSLGIYLWHIAFYQYIALPAGWNPWVMFLFSFTASLLCTIAVKTATNLFYNLKNPKPLK